MKRQDLAAAALVALALAVWWLGGYSARDRLGEILVWAVLAMSLDLLVGRAGMVSLGHALFFGAGAYGVAVLTALLKWPAAPSLLLAVLGAGLLALVVGALAVRLHGVFFIMVTLAFGQMGWAFAQKERALGGVGGLSGVKQLDLSAVGLQLADPGDFALAALVLAVAVYLLLRLVAASPFGQVLAAIRENEARTRALGCPVRAYRLAAFALAGLLAGVAGAAAAQRTGFVSPDLLVWTVSGEVLIMVIVGGMGSIVGPAAGAAAWVLLQHALSGATPYWGVPMGLFFVAIVLFAGDGFWGLVRAHG